MINCSLLTPGLPPGPPDCCRGPLCLATQLLTFLLCTSFAHPSSSFQNCSSPIEVCIWTKMLKTEQYKQKRVLSPAPQCYLEKAFAFFSINFKHHQKKKKNTTASVFSWLRAIIGLCHFHPDSHYSHWYQGISFNFQSLYSPLSRLSSRGQLLQGFMGKLVLPPLMPYSPGEGSVLWCF